MIDFASILEAFSAFGILLGGLADFASIIARIVLIFIT